MTARAATTALAGAAAVGLSASASLAAGLSGGPLAVCGVAVVAGLAVHAAVRALGAGSRAAVVLALLAPAVGTTAVASLLVVPVLALVPALQGVVSLTAWAVVRRVRVLAVLGTVAVPALASLGLVAGAGAWSVDDPATTSASARPGNGIDVTRDTHAFLVQQGAVILAGDGRTAQAAFLASPDPTAPTRPDGTHQSYLWRVQLGARDADRVLKATAMPDHFFNWWTHSGKGVVAGTSGATWAEQQHAAAVASWRAGDRATAMYHLGAAVHLVDDACAPPHASPYVPDHRVYEEWVLAQQARYAVRSGGIYQQDFRVGTGHGGAEWSSAHTRGWVDECAHRAAELVVNTAQPPPDRAGDPTSYTPTMAHFQDAQRLTAGYLAFFLDSVGGP